MKISPVTTDLDADHHIRRTSINNTNLLTLINPRRRLQLPENLTLICTRKDQPTSGSFVRLRFQMQVAQRSYRLDIITGPSDVTGQITIQGKALRSALEAIGFDYLPEEERAEWWLSPDEILFRLKEKVIVEALTERALKQATKALYGKPSTTPRAMALLWSMQDGYIHSKEPLIASIHQSPDIPPVHVEILLKISQSSQSLRSLSRPPIFLCE